jgi:tripartite-type tricarboxylate transporter receptor subunit TctC
MQGADMTPLFRIFALGALVLASTNASAALSAGDSYPSKLIRIVVGFPAGGPADIGARVLAAGLQETFKQTVIVDNRSGAGGTIAAQLVAKSPPDGYTLLVATASLTLNPALSPNVGYDPVKDFTPVGLLATQANALAVTYSLPVNTLKELQALMRKHKMTFATAGVGTSSHLSATYLINVLWKSDATPVPYRGAGPAGIAVATGETPIAFMTVTGVLPLQQQRKVKILAVVSDKRLAALPDVATMRELGYPQLTPSWTAAFVPSDTPSAVVQRLNEAINQAIASADFKEKMITQGMVAAAPSTTKQLADYIRSEAQVWERIVKTTGAKPE